MNLEIYWQQAQTWTDFLATAEANREMWQELSARAVVPQEMVRRVEEQGDVRLLVLGADWCGDAVNTLPVLGKLAELSGCMEIRHLDRDAFPALMATHLTNGSHSIPVVMILDAQYRELGWWGPRPSVLQEWVMREGKQLPSGEKYRQIRMWYARDRGASTLREVVDLIERSVERARAA